MKKSIGIFILTLCLFTAGAQSFLTGKRSITFIDNNRSNRAVATDLYYPANTAGNNVPVASGAEKFPVVVFGHGFLIGNASYNWLADSLVKYGYIVALPSTESGISPNHGNFGEDLAFLCGRITSLNDSSGSFLLNRVIKKAAVGGHSMGGGASFLAAAGTKPSINALFNFAAAETNPSATQAALLNEKPALVFSGSSDCIVLPAVQEAMYNNMSLACKTYINITGGLHCQFANNNSTCVLGQLTSGCNSSSVNATLVFSKTMSMIVPFIDFYLKDICTGGQVFSNIYNNLTGVTKRQSCQTFPTCGPLPVKLTGFYGNYKNNQVFLYWNTASEYHVDHISIERSQDGVSFSHLAKVLPKGSNGAGASYSNVDSYPYSGINFYRLKIVDLDGSTSYSEIIKFVTAKKSLVVTQLYPNPVSEFLYLQLQSDKRQVINYTIFELSGRKCYRNKEELKPGLNEMKLPFADLARAVYIIRLGSNEGIKAVVFKIIKQ